MREDRAAEQRGYAKGYTAGRKRVELEGIEAFRRQVFLAALPNILQGGWTRGEVKLNTGPLMVETAWSIANQAVKQELKNRGR